MLKNRIYNFNRWLDNNESYKVLILFISVGLFVLMINIPKLMFFGIGGILLMSFYTIIRVKILDGVIKFDKSKYTIPEIGETVVVNENFVPLSYIGDDLLKGKEYKIIDITESDDDWILTLKTDSNFLYDTHRVSYIRHKKYFDTKSDIRNKKLEKLLK